MKTYEFQAFRNGRWEIQAAFTNREEAVREARRAVGDNRFPGIRVTEEIFNEGSNLTRTRSIFNYEYSAALDRSGREEEKLSGLKNLRSGLRTKHKPGLLAERYGGLASTQSFGASLLRLFAILLLGVLSLIGLHTLFSAS